ncbi:hypothetical protein DDP54_03290 [Cellulomonas sp. WB94]|uniref:trimeric intracellular cation channel family protein n=1 Tax=Cellulomonas sp. WB94 TaxID=2173174 RepID=UPI000D587922|nr:trimeric intracellular cation channel family protein [Cellulomonas sp. WB94]PVU82191.1 hypothetical protein DDP54_03290 [Cellulomonas sp. WB94]
MTGTQVVLALDLLGTVTFALNGALTASRRVRLDIVGVLSLGVITAVGGGLVRDVLLGATPPAAFEHWYYLAAAGAGAAAAWVIARPPRGLHRAIVVLDAIGLSVFCVTGAHKAIELGLQPAPAILLGAITAVGGGTLRDVLVGDVPSVLTSELYAIPALAGATVAALAGTSTAAAAPAAVLGAVLCFAIRMVGVHFDLHAPARDPHEAPTDE